MKKAGKKAAKKAVTKETTTRKKAAKKTRTKIVKKAIQKTVKKTLNRMKMAALIPAGVPNIDYSLCQGCGGCAEAFPQLFEMRGERAWVINPETFDPVRDAGVMTICPYYAISIEKV